MRMRPPATSSRIARSTALQGLDKGEAHVIGMPARLTVRDSVLMNGILVHGLDFDDTYLPAPYT